MAFTPADHDARARALLATCQNVPTPADDAAEAASEARDEERYMRLLGVSLAAHAERYGTAAVPACLARSLTARYVGELGYSVRRAPARTPGHVVLTLYRDGGNA